MSCKIFYLLFLSPQATVPPHPCSCGGRQALQNYTRQMRRRCSQVTRLINILVFLMFLLHFEYHSLLIIADVLLLAAVVPSVVVQLVCSIYISPVSFGIFGSSSCVGRFLSVHCDLVCVRVSFVDFNCYRFDSSLQVLLGCHVMLQACL